MKEWMKTALAVAALISVIAVGVWTYPRASENDNLYREAKHAEQRALKVEAEVREIGAKQRLYVLKRRPVPSATGVSYLDQTGIRRQAEFQPDKCKWSIEGKEVSGVEFNEYCEGLD